MIFRAIVITIVCHLSNAFVEAEYDDNLDGIAITPLNFNSNDYPVNLTQRKLTKKGKGTKHDKKSSKKSAACKKSKVIMFRMQSVINIKHNFLQYCS